MRHALLVILGRAGILAVVCGCVLLVLSGCVESEQSVGGPASRLAVSKPTGEVNGDLPPSAMTLHSLAKILAAQGKDRECEFVLRTCVRQHPQFLPAYNNLAELFMRQGRANEAIEILSNALQINPRDPVLLNNLGMCYLVSRQYEKALANFTAAAGIVPGREKYRVNMATALGLLGRQDEAAALLEQVLSADAAAHDAQVLQKAHEKLSDAAKSPPQ
jgi:Flp pilus assembly protein TadD